MHKNTKIPFNKPYIAGKELYYIAKAVTYWNIAGDGFFTQECSRLLERRLKIGKVLLTNSCTSALEMASMLCELGPGDEVVLPSYTFVSTVSAVVRLGATPIFVDIRPDTLNIDETRIDEAITARTKAIIAVHYAGVACEMDTICNIAKRHNLFVIEDAAQGVNSYYGERALGSIGDLGTFSFHQTKNYMCGEGGALCINNPDLVKRAEIIRDKGTNRKQFFRGEVDKYTWVDMGSSYVPSEILAAFLLAQLEMLDDISERRKRIFETYRQGLKSLEDYGLLRLPRIPSPCVSNYHMFYILLNDAASRDGLIDYLLEHNIFAAFHYVPLHTSPMGAKVAPSQKSLPATDEYSKRLLRLPFYYELTDEEQTRVIRTISDYFTMRNNGAAAPKRRSVSKDGLASL